MKIIPSAVFALLFIVLVCTVSADDLRFSEDGKLTNVKDTRDLKVIIRPVERKDISQYGGIIKRCAAKYDLEPSLIRAVIQAESNWDPLAVSHKGAMGLMQLMPETAKLLGVENPFDPAQNIEGGTKYLAELMEAFNERLDLALAAYNAGPTVVSSLGRIPKNRETPYYVRKVMAVFRSDENSDSEPDEEVVEEEASGKSKKPHVASEAVFLCEDERGKPIITNTGVSVIRGG
jgi:hypothetical protein